MRFRALLTENGVERVELARVYLLLARIEEDWKIVCKLYAHTAGEPPEGV